MSNSAKASRAARVYLRYVRTIEAMGIATMAALVSIIVAQVVCRYLLGFSLYWADEVTKTLMIWTAFFMAGVAYTQGELPAMRLLVEKLPPKALRCVDIAMSVLIVLALILLARYGFEFAWRTRHQSMIALNISLFWAHLSIPVGCLLLIFHVSFHKWLAPIQPHLETPVELAQ